MKPSAVSNAVADRAMQAAYLRQAQNQALLDLRAEERAAYSLVRALETLGTGRPVAGFEGEISQELMRIQPPTAANSMIVPYWALSRGLSAANAQAGGYLADTDVRLDAMLEFLRDHSVIASLPVTRLPGLTGNVDIPVELTPPTGQVLGTESTAATASEGEFGSAALTPKSCAAITKVSRQFLKQGGIGAEAYVRRSLAAAVGYVVDDQALNGNGLGGQALGLLATPGIGSVSGTSLAQAGIREFQTDIGAGLGVGCAFVTTRTIASLLNGRQKFTGTDATLWQGNLHRGEMGAWPAMTGENVPASHLAFGNWSHLAFAEFGVGLEVSVNPFEASDFRIAKIMVRAICSFDVALLRPASFSVATAVT